MWTASSPANIALIKYMGKYDGNVAYNISLSYTLHKFQTVVSLELNNIGKDVFQNINIFDEERFLSHLLRIKKLTNFSGTFTIHSRNNFPTSAGIASSASSFSALTICAFKSICDITKSEMPSIQHLSDISRLASGSSCRSFFSPWCVWKGDKAEKADLPDLNLQHDLVLISTEKKKISSSQAHELVKTSLLMNGRKERAETRLTQLVTALKNKDWQLAYQICYAEFIDMHALFETSFPHFGYITHRTMLVLEEIQNFWNKNNDGPVVTIDAGPNIHLLWRADSERLREQLKKNLKNRDQSIEFL